LNSCKLLFAACLVPAVLGQTAVTSVTPLEPPSIFTDLSTREITGSSPTAEIALSSATGTWTNPPAQTPSEAASGTRTSSAQQPAQTQPCNLHVEFCARRYSNITYVGAHNSPFVGGGNMAANQNLDVKAQLNDGIRMRIPRANT